MSLSFFPRRIRTLPGLLLFFSLAVATMAQEKPRLLVLTDIGGDPDDQQSLIRLLVWANEFEIEGLIASAAGTPGELKTNVVKPELIREIVQAYGAVRENLSRHVPGYPSAQQLLERVRTGNPERGTNHIGPGRNTAGSDWIVTVVDRPDPRPVNIVIWGGSTELAQALWRVRQEREAGRLRAFLDQIRVHAISHQDDTGPWILANFPDLFYLLSMAPEGKDRREGAYRGMYLDGDQELTSRAWIDTHVRLNHGPLGALYPTRTWTAPNPHSTLKEGDTPSWFYFLPNGLSDPAHPEWGGWGGRFERRKGGLYRDAADTVGGVTHARVGVWRWRPAFQNEFQARMDWCVHEPARANHPPVAVLNGDTSRAVLRLNARAGATLRLDASGSTDPDRQSLTWRWWVYPEAGTYKGVISLPEADKPVLECTIPTDAAGQTIHLILEVTDTGQPPLTSYRRAVLQVEGVAGP